MNNKIDSAGGAKDLPGMWEESDLIGGEADSRESGSAYANANPQPAEGDGAVVSNADVLRAVDVYDNAMGEGWQLPSGKGMRAVLEDFAATSRPAATAVVPDAPIKVFDLGPWIYEPEGMRFSGPQLDGAAFAEYRRFLAAAPAAPKGGDGMYYLQDTRQYVGNCPMWWCPDGRGYTTRLDLAGRYTREQAMRQHAGRETDVPWPCAQIDAIQRPTVDMQDMRRLPKVTAALANQEQRHDALADGESASA